LHEGFQTYECCFKQVNLRPGHSIAVSLWMESHGVIDHIEDAGIIQISDGRHSHHLSTEHNQGVIVCDYTCCIRQGRWLAHEK
jgi:hypothetical protein